MLCFRSWLCVLDISQFDWNTLEKMMLELLISILLFFAYLQPFMVIYYPYLDFFIGTLTVKATLHDSHLRRQTCEQGHVLGMVAHCRILTLWEVESRKIRSSRPA